MKPSSQCAKILKHLQSGRTLTPASAYRLFGVLCMHSRAAELRSRGHRIETRMVKVGRKYVGQYRMFTGPRIA